MLRQKAKGLFVLLLGAWLLAACATGAPSTAVDNTAPPPAAQAEAPPTTGAIVEASYTYKHIR